MNVYDFTFTFSTDFLKLYREQQKKYQGEQSKHETARKEIKKSMLPPSERTNNQKEKQKKRFMFYGRRIASI